jgi:putative NADPH-quinone reductase
MQLAASDGRHLLTFIKDYRRVLRSNPSAAGLEENVARIIVIVGHSRKGTLCEALGRAYVEGAARAGHEASLFVLARMSFDAILTGSYVEVQPLEPDLRHARQALYAADHIVIVFPLWLGDMPAILKGFLERVFQPDLIDPAKQSAFVPLLKGKSARIIVTMGTPEIAYRWYFGPHAPRILSGNILGFMGVSPIGNTVFGRATNVDGATRQGWIEKVTEMGRNRL